MSAILDIVNPEDRAAMQQHFIDTDHRIPAMLYTYGRFAWVGQDLLAAEQVEVADEKAEAESGASARDMEREKAIKRTVVRANEKLVNYLEARGMIWYNEEARQ